jgi:hypothetical protein
MRFYEFEAKALLGKAGMPVAKGGTATSADEAARIAASVGGEVVLKSQVLSGGRMKAGGVKFAATPDEARRMSEKDLREIAQTRSFTRGLPARITVVPGGEGVFFLHAYSTGDKRTWANLVFTADVDPRVPDAELAPFPAAPCQRAKLLWRHVSGEPHFELAVFFYYFHNFKCNCSPLSGILILISKGIRPG